MTRKKSLGAFSRRDFLKASLLSAGAAAGAAAMTKVSAASDRPALPAELTGHDDGHIGHGPGNGVVGEVDTSRFDPMTYLTSFDYGQVSSLPGGQTLREWNMIAGDIEIEVAPGITFAAWAYNGQVPGPTLRCTQGDRLRVNFLNGSSHPHTIHFHGIHPPSMDGFEPLVQPGERFVYEFDAKPFGLHLYHCHAMPLKRHIHKGLYGTFIIDPPGGRPPAKELVLMMNGFDTNFDGENEIYSANTVAFYYARHPIQVKVGEPVRIYLVNITEFDPVNSLHLHSGMYRLYRTGTDLERFELTDVVTMGQGERHVLELTLENPGLHMIHAHQSELAELGWMGFIEAVT